MLLSEGFLRLLHHTNMSNTVMETCANPGCSEPGTNKCASCKITPYCGPICQTAHWPTHKESCDGRLRKMGMDYLDKALRLHREHNWTQALRYGDLAATKLKQLKDRPIEQISESTTGRKHFVTVTLQQRN